VLQRKQQRRHDRRDDDVIDIDALLGLSVPVAAATVTATTTVAEAAATTVAPKAEPLVESPVVSELNIAEEQESHIVEEEALEPMSEAAVADVAGRRASVQKELDFVNFRRESASRIVDLMANGDIPERTTHNDTKINNVMLAPDGSNVVIDLDTTMPGSALYDFGDMVRTSSAAAAEDEQDLSKVYSKKEYFEALVRGYTSSAKFLNEAEKANLAFSARLITLTIGIRFLTDYLSGDTYFHTAYPEHNLVRCHTQFKMVESMEAQSDLYESIVKAYVK
jgi:hypothetical protein